GSVVECDLDIFLREAVLVLFSPFKAFFFFLFFFFLMCLRGERTLREESEFMNAARKPFGRPRPPASKHDDPRTLKSKSLCSFVFSVSSASLSSPTSGIPSGGQRIGVNLQQ